MYIPPAAAAHTFSSDRARCCDCTDDGCSHLASFVRVQLCTSLAGAHQMLAMLHLGLGHRQRSAREHGVKPQLHLQVRSTIQKVLLWQGLQWPQSSRRKPGHHPDGLQPTILSQGFSPLYDTLCSCLSLSDRSMADANVGSTAKFMHQRNLWKGYFSSNLTLLPCSYGRAFSLLSSHCSGQKSKTHSITVRGQPMLCVTFITFCRP